MITQTELNGMPVLLAPQPGPIAAGLVFRVGRADETLATGGITHLVEHLVLHEQGLSDYHFNGATANLFTHFHVQGSEVDVVSYLNAVCASIARPPLDRIAIEKEILRTEGSKRDRSSLPMWRFGAIGHGLASYPEWGLHRLDSDDVQAWLARWFTHDNAVLWISGDRIPSGLNLTLPTGRRCDVPPFESTALPTTPAYFVEGSGEVAWHAVAPRGPALTMFNQVLERELFRTLRQDGGYSYTVAAASQPLDRDTAAVIAVADALTDKQPAVVGGFIDILAKLRVGRIDPTDLVAVLAKAEEGFKHPHADAGRLSSCAADLLLGRPVEQLNDLRDRVHAVTVDDVHSVAVEAIESSLLNTPVGTRADWADFASAPRHSTNAVSGYRHRSKEHADSSVLVVGAEGVSIVTDHGPATVRYDKVQAALRWPDGGRLLIASDAISVRIEPTLWKIDSNTLASIDAATPPSTVVPLPARDPDSVPQPNARAAAPAAPSGRLLSIGAKLLVGLSGLLTLVAACGAAFMSVEASQITENKVLAGGIVAMTWIVTVIFALPMVFILQRRPTSPG